MNFMTNQIIKRNKELYIYIYIYVYLINCEYFNNLNEDGYYGGDMYIPIPIPIPNWKSRGFPIPTPIPSQCGDSPSKRERVYLPSLHTTTWHVAFFFKKFKKI